jgi:hypothetical protein
MLSSRFIFHSIYVTVCYPSSAIRATVIRMITLSIYLQPVTTWVLRMYWHDDDILHSNSYFWLLFLPPMGISCTIRTNSSSLFHNSLLEEQPQYMFTWVNKNSLEPRSLDNKAKITLKRLLTLKLLQFWCFKIRSKMVMADKISQYNSMDDHIDEFLDRE